MSATLILRFTRLSDDRHRFEYRRADGTGEAIEMESEGLLLRDLARYAVESEAGLRGSFYGILAKIGGYEELCVAGGAALGGEIAITEAIVETLMLTGADEAFDAADFCERVEAALAFHDARLPRWLTDAFASAAFQRLVELANDWRAMTPGGTIEVALKL